MVEYDVLVVGAGILGLASAYHLKRGHPEKKILVVDRNSAAGQENTAKANGCFRNVFSSQTNFLLADSSIDFYLHIQEDWGHNLGLEKIGYLWLLSEEQFKANLQTFENVRAKGVELRVFEREDLARMIPGVVLEFDERDEEARILGLKSVDKGVFGSKCGSLDANALVRFYEREFKQLGGVIQFNTNVTALVVEPEEWLEILGEPFVWQSKRVPRVKTNKGEISADKIILTPGVWANQLLDPIGIDSHMKPKKRQIFVVKGRSLKSLFNIKGFSEENVQPFTILPKSGIFLRPAKNEGSFWVGCSDDLGRPYKLEKDPKAESSFYDQIYMILAKYFPHFENLRPVNMWAGLYAINSIDGNSYIFEEAGMIVVAGASGSGIMKADAIGRIVAALYEGKEHAELYNGRPFRVSDLSINQRKVGREKFVL